MMERHLERRVWAGSFVLVVVVFLVILTIMSALGSHDMKDMEIDKKRESFISLKTDIIGEQIEHGKYRCCLEKPCNTCVSLSPYHGEGAECSCIEDLVNGVGPCGECVGGILAGRGNPYLAEYFARAIAEEIGEEHIDILRGIVEEKYDLAVEEQY